MTADDLVVDVDEMVKRPETSGLAGLAEPVDESLMDDGTLVAPEIAAAQLSERQPQAGMHVGVVGRILILDGRKVFA